MTNITHKYVFVDLDETLLHTKVHRKKPAGDNYLDLGDDVFYVAELREGAYDLLRDLRAMVGAENVLMLTTSVEDYAHGWNKKFEFGFQKIFHRNDIREQNIRAEEFPNADGVYLIDNLYASENRSKIDFLWPIHQSVKYIQISEYWGGDNPIAPHERQRILDQIRAS
jgi:hypothetical protein